MYTTFCSIYFKESEKIRCARKIKYCKSNIHIANYHYICTYVSVHMPQLTTGLIVSSIHIRSKTKNQFQ